MFRNYACVYVGGICACGSGSAEALPGARHDESAAARARSLQYTRTAGTSSNPGCLCTAEWRREG